MYGTLDSQYNKLAHDILGGVMPDIARTYLRAILDAAMRDDPKAVDALFNLLGETGQYHNPDCMALTVRVNQFWGQRRLRAYVRDQFDSILAQIDNLVPHVAEHDGLKFKDNRDRYALLALLHAVYHQKMDAIWYWDGLLLSWIDGPANDYTAKSPVGQCHVMILELWEKMGVKEVAQLCGS